MFLFVARRRSVARTSSTAARTALTVIWSITTAKVHTHHVPSNCQSNCSMTNEYDIETKTDAFATFVKFCCVVFLSENNHVLLDVFLNVLEFIFVAIVGVVTYKQTKEQ